MKMKQTLIIGAGHAGQNLHLKTLKKLEINTLVGFVDNNIIKSIPGINRKNIFKNLSSVDGFPADSTVVHICTPPQSHKKIIEELLQMGYMNIIIEKPMSNNYKDAIDINTLIIDSNSQGTIFVVANWLYSKVIWHLRDKLSDTKHAVSTVKMQQSKPRFEKTTSNTYKESIFDIEMPHLVVLAMYLFGKDLKYNISKCGDMVYESITYKNMGWATLEMVSREGFIINLETSLVFISMAYGAFNEEGAALISNGELNLEVCKMLEKAKSNSIHCP